MKENDFSFLIVSIMISSLLFLVIIGNYVDENKKLKIQVETIKKEENKDFLLEEYQESFKIFMDKNPECALEFSKIIDSINRK